MIGDVSQLLAHGRPERLVLLGPGTVPKFGDFLPKWQGVLVNHNLLNSGVVSLMWERGEISGPVGVSPISFSPRL